MYLTKKKIVESLKEHMLIKKKCKLIKIVVYFISLIQPHAILFSLLTSHNLRKLYTNVCIS